MELTIITMLCIGLGLSILLTPCDCRYIQLHSSHEQALDLSDHELPFPPTLPRKLRLTEDVTVKGRGGKDSTLYFRPKEAGKPHHKEASIVHRRAGTWQEWVEGPDASQYFTMDYSNVKRRRPIHNKSVPVGP